MQLAKIHKETGKLQLLPSALKRLRELPKGLLIVALFGGARSAKSTTANMLLGKQVFGVSNATDPCTLGVWMDTRPHDGKVLIVVDSEGMGKGDTSQHSKILALVSLLASDGGALLDNEMKDLGEHNLGTLGILATMQQMVRGAQKYSWPALFVLLRDFTLSLVVARRPATPTQYLNHILEDPGTSPDETRKLIRDCFIYRSLHTLPPPTEQELMSMLNLPPGNFSNGFEALKKELFGCLTNKMVADVEIDGEQLADFLETCVEALNKDDGINLPDVREVVVERFCYRTVDQLEKKYQSDMSEFKLTGDEKALQEHHDNTKPKVLASYDESTSGFTSEVVVKVKGALESKILERFKLLDTENKLIAEKIKQEKQNQEKKLAPRKIRADLNMVRPFTQTILPLSRQTAADIQALKDQNDDLNHRVQGLELNRAIHSPQQPAPPTPQVVLMINSPPPPTPQVIHPSIPITSYSPSLPPPNYPRSRSPSPTPDYTNAVPNYTGGPNYTQNQYLNPNPNPSPNPNSRNRRSPSPVHFTNTYNGPVPNQGGHRMGRG